MRSRSFFFAYFFPYQYKNTDKFRKLPDEKLETGKRLAVGNQKHKITPA
jgi:hypothetical protein